MAASRDCTVITANPIALARPKRILWAVPRYLRPMATAEHENGYPSIRGLSKSEGALTSCRQQHQWWHQQEWSWTRREKKRVKALSF
jgi:hypothetical protein